MSFRAAGDRSCLVVTAAAAVVAMASARPYAGSWNDGSRLATVEALVDYHTFAIDRSIFVAPDRAAVSPYEPGNQALARTGTLDKLYIRGRFYSDKSPVPALPLAAEYAVLQRATGLAARDRPGAFCYWLTLGSSGVSYVVAVVAIFSLARRLLGPRRAFIVTSSFALATVALTYTRQVNNHILLLAILAWLMRLWDELVREPAGRARVALCLAIGVATGAGYTVDLGIAPALLIASAVLIAARRSVSSALAFGIGALPFIALHHATTYHLGGGLAPANSVAEYLAWPGSPFADGTMTGRWSHPSVWHFLGYAVQLLVGKRGFLLHNLPLLLVPAASVWLMRAKRPLVERPAIAAAGALMVASWLGYAALSTNYSGVSASIRWFVPLLAPGFYIIVVWLRERSDRWPPFLVLSAWSAIIAALLWIRGPWVGTMVPFYWGWVGAALISWWMAVLRAPALAKS